MATVILKDDACAIVEECNARPNGFHPAGQY